jgi:hypothetical protein
MKRILIGGIVAGIAVFVWGALSHTILPTAKLGIKQIPNEEAVLSAMKASIQEPGFYFFPGMDLSREPTPEEESAWNARYLAGPTGVLVYHPTGSTPMSPQQLLAELASNIIAALLAAFVIFHVAAGFGQRALIVTLLGLFAWMSVSVSHWNWHGFPASTTLNEAIDQVGGWFFGGLVLAAIVKPPTK